MFISRERRSSPRDTSNLAAEGRLAVVSLGLPLVISQPQLAAGNIVLAITGGTPGNPCYLVASTNVAAPAALWQPVATNTFDAGGQTVFTNAVNPALKDRYFRVRLNYE